MLSRGSEGEEARAGRATHRQTDVRHRGGGGGLR